MTSRASVLCLFNVCANYVCSFVCKCWPFVCSLCNHAGDVLARTLSTLDEARTAPKALLYLTVLHGENIENCCSNF